MRTIAKIVLGCLVGLAILIGFSNPASANTPPVGTNVCNTTTTGVTNCIQLTQVSASKASDSVSDTTVAVSKAVANAKNIVGVHYSFNEKKAVKAKQCFYDTGLNGGYWINHPGFTYQRETKKMHICASSKSPTGYIKIGGGYDNQDCHNPVIPDHKPKRVKHPRVVTGFKFVMYAATSFKATASATSKSIGSASAHASAHNADNSCVASADATESSYGYAYASASAYGSTKSSAIANAKGKLSKVEVQQSTHVTAEGNAKATASTKASGTASAQASCTATVVPQASYSCTGLSATPNNGPYDLNYTFAVSASVQNTQVTGSKFQVINASGQITYVGSNSLNAQFHFPQAGSSYTVQGQVLTSSGATDWSQCTMSVTPQSPPPPAQSVSITSMTQLNMIAVGKTSGSFYIGVNASAAGGSLTVDPGIGGVSTCDSSTPQDSVTFSNLGSGNSTQCVILYAPNDADQPSSMTVTATATLGSATPAVQKENVNITYPTRP